MPSGQSTLWAFCVTARTKPLVAGEPNNGVRLEGELKNISLRRATTSGKACHPCAGAMLIFSVSFQFYYMSPGGDKVVLPKTGLVDSDFTIECRGLRPLKPGTRGATTAAIMCTKTQRNHHPIFLLFCMTNIGVARAHMQDVENRARSGNKNPGHIGSPVQNPNQQSSWILYVVSSTVAFLSRGFDLVERPIRWPVAIH